MLDNLTTITFEFSLDKNNKTSLSKVYGGVTINGNTNYFPNYTTNVAGPHSFIANESLFVTSISNSYRCNSETKIDNFKTDGNVTIKSIDLKNLRIQPFVNNTVVFTDYATGMLKKLNLVFLTFRFSIEKNKISC
jgi:hypothetical protein